MSLPDHYKTLGLKSSATPEEIKRAYRILARRYHPDVNPDISTQERFKQISDAYKTLSDSKLRGDYDFEFGQQRYRKAHSEFYDFMREADKRKRQQTDRGGEKTRVRSSATKKMNGARTVNQASRREAAKSGESIVQRATTAMRQTWEKMHSLLTWEIPFLTRKREQTGSLKVSVLEVSLSIHEALTGAKKVIEYEEDGVKRRVSVSIPSGVRNGSVVRMRNSKGGHTEELIVIPRIAPHPFVSIDSRGVIVEVPISLHEAMYGASITVPTFEDQKVLKIPEGTQSGFTMRLKERGATRSNGERSDLLYRFIIYAPDASGAVGLKEQSQALEQYYSGSVRSGMPRSLGDTD